MKINFGKVLIGLGLAAIGVAVVGSVVNKVVKNNQQIATDDVVEEAKLMRQEAKVAKVCKAVGVIGAGIVAAGLVVTFISKNKAETVETLKLFDGLESTISTEKPSYDAVERLYAELKVGTVTIEAIDGYEAVRGWDAGVLMGAIDHLVLGYAGTGFEPDVKKFLNGISDLVVDPDLSTMVREVI